MHDVDNKQGKLDSLCISFLLKLGYQPNCETRQRHSLSIFVVEIILSVAYFSVSIYSFIRADYIVLLLAIIWMAQIMVGLEKKRRKEREDLGGAKSSPADLRLFIGALFIFACTVFTIWFILVNSRGLTYPLPVISLIGPLSCLVYLFGFLEQCIEILIEFYGAFVQPPIFG